MALWRWTKAGWAGPASSAWLRLVMLQAANTGGSFWTFHCIFQEALCCKPLKMDHVMKAFVRAVNLNHCQFECLLSDDHVTHTLPYHTEVRGLSRGAVLRHFFDLREEIGQLMEKKKGNPVMELQCQEWLQDLAFLVEMST